MRIAAIITLALFAVVGYSQCFTVGTGNRTITSGDGNWTTNSNWTNPASDTGCSMTTEGEQVQVGHNMTIYSASCGTFSMTAKTNLQVVNNSTLTIEGNFNMSGEEVCLYIETGSKIIVLGNVNYTKNKIEMEVDGTFQVTGNFNCTGDCTGGGATWPTFGGTGSYIATDCTGGFANTQCDDAIASSILPVELISYKVMHDQGHAKLNWTTATEINNSYFTVEKSIDGIDYAVIGRVLGHGTSKEVHTYEFIDQEVSNGLGYYKLSQTDYDGTQKILGIRLLTPGTLDASLKVFPNPVSGTLKFEYPITSGGRLEILSISGKLVTSERLDPGTIHSLECMNLETGTYFMKVTDDIGQIRHSSFAVR